MRRKVRIFQHSNTQGYRLREHIDPHHPFVELADIIDWAPIDRVATRPVQSGPGRPILRPRLIAGLLYMQHAFSLFDEQGVAGCLKNPYRQVFTGETHLQTEPISCSGFGFIEMQNLVKLSLPQSLSSRLSEEIARWKTPANVQCPMLLNSGCFRVKMPAAVMGCAGTLSSQRVSEGLCRIESLAFQIMDPLLVGINSSFYFAYSGVQP